MLSTLQRVDYMKTELNDLIFWASCFWQQEKPPENPKDMPEWYLTDEGAMAISDAVSSLGFEISPSEVHQVYSKRI